MTKPEWEAIPDVRISSYMGALNKWIAMNAFFVFVVIPNETGDIYAAVKKKLCIESPIPSQVVTISKVLKKVIHSIIGEIVPFLKLHFNRSPSWFGASTRGERTLILCNVVSFALPKLLNIDLVIIPVGT